MKKKTSYTPHYDVKLVSSIFAYQFLKKYRLDDILRIPKYKRTEEMKLWLRFYETRILRYRKYESPLNDMKHKINLYSKLERPFKIYYIMYSSEAIAYKYDEYIKTPDTPHYMFVCSKKTKLLCVRYNKEKDLIEFFRVPNIKGHKLLKLQDDLARILKIKERNIDYKRYTKV